MYGIFSSMLNINNQVVSDGFLQTSSYEGLVVGLTSISAGGKSYIAKHLVADGMVTPQYTDTDRHMRPDECSLSYDHHFITPAEFEIRRSLGGYVVAQKFYGNNYGLPDIENTGSVELPVLVLIKPQVAEALRKAFSNTLIYGIESLDGNSLDALVSRMRERGQTEADIAQRVARAKEEGALGTEVVDDGRMFTAEGHPKTILPFIQSALRTDFEQHTLVRS